MNDAELCELIGKGLLTAEQRQFLRDERLPRWDLNPPQRENFTDAEAYVRDLRRYVTAAMDKPRKPMPAFDDDMEDFWGFGG